MRTWSVIVLIILVSTLLRRLSSLLLIRHLCFLQLFQVLIQTIRQQDLPTSVSSLPPLHLSNQLAPFRLNLLFLKFHLSLFHRTHFPLMSRLLILLLLPLLIGDAWLNLIQLFLLLFLLLALLLLLLSEFLIQNFLFVAEERDRKPLLKHLLCFFFLLNLD